ncbi:DUF805 domain-containing protein [Sedimentitalea todarodis]|uniref:DUF805 domain-containing protein n=1 Tax=Sedimentitalea todarodis TaxID=1631240 RepID=A0ABU3VLI3_9RHOB|nr:DUF805 domain-containing protein [Sedimentitalea todarodis]MDU9007038.1 DUF805 domain-containing protein [Sedimentitalea todarodis]
MGFTQSVKTCLPKYAVFSGRARRSEYWWFVLFVVVISIGLTVLGAVFFGTDPETGQGSNLLNSVFQLAMLLPLLAAGWRRLHDTGRPGWYLLIPMAFSLAMMVMLLTGVAVFTAIETGVQDPEALQGPAAILGATGVMVMYVIQLIISVLMIWWLSRPSQEGANDYGAPSQV